MKLKPPFFFSRGRRQRRVAFALVVVLIVISVLALVAVGYLSSMSQERATASAFANKTRAEQSAQSGVDTAVGILRDYFKAFPDSATVWEALSKNPDNTTNDGTAFYFHALPDANNLPNANPNAGDTTANSATGNGPNNVSTSTGVDNRSIFVMPLTSGATPVLAANRSPTPLGTSTSIDLNARRYVGDDQGWIGTPPDYTYPTTARLPRQVRVPWVDVTQQDSGVGGTPPVVARYAFWVEDESFRANITYADAGQAPASPRRDNANNALLNPTDLSLVGLFTFLGDADPTGSRSSLIDARKSYPGNVFPEARAYAHSTGVTTSTNNALRYLTTSQSSALNLSRHGTQRLNLNQVVPQADLPADKTAATQVIQDQINRLVAAIKFHTPASSQGGSLFGQRLFRTSAATDATTLNALQVPDDGNKYPLIYLYKVAANIRDYIDKDSTPTIINAGGTVRYGTKAMHPFAGPNGLDGANEIWAQGKDSAPYIEETATRFRGGHLATDSSKYQIAIDYYVELWNSSNLDVKATDLGPHPVIRVANPTQWVSTSPVDPTCPSTDPAPANGSPYDSRFATALRDYDIDLASNVYLQGALAGSGVIFKAGVATVITTDPQYAQLITDTNAQANVYLCGFYPAAPDPAAVGKRIFNGTLPFLTDGTTRAAGLKMIFGAPSGQGATGSSDYDTELMLETDNGIVDSTYGGLPMSVNPNQTVFLTAATQPDPNLSPATPTPIFGGSLKGNNDTVYPGQLGDPRSNNEQLIYTIYKSNSISDQTRYFKFTDMSNVGRVNSNYVLPASTGSYVPWGDYYFFPSDYKMSAANAPYIIANSTLTSIGQLGDVYDPLRIASSAANVGNARGGGRTFKIGQHDDRWDGSATSASRNWTSWRLADFFCVSDAMEQPGLININGVARDNGAALRAALGGFKFQSTTSGTSLLAQPAGKDLNTDRNSPGLQSMIDQIKARLSTSLPATFSNGYNSVDNTGSGPFFERGELSELPAFGHNGTTGTSSTNLVSGVNMATTLDRGREELFRRLVEMITTRGDVFTVYAVGQSLVPTTTANRQVLSTQQMRVTFKLVPKDDKGKDFHPATDANGNPVNLDPASPKDRFAKPDHYDIQVLSSSSSNS